MNIYLDACHGGSFIKEAVKWAKKYSIHRHGDYQDVFQEVDIYFFQELVYLDLHVLTSAAEDEFAMDAGEGKGGRWTNHFFAKGKLPKWGDWG
jgi:hypothetical protein